MGASCRSRSLSPTRSSIRRSPNRDDLPKKGRKTEAVSGEPRLPAVLEGAITSLYHNYQKYHDRWLANAEARSSGLTPPVFIVVCNNTNVSKIVFDYIAGWEKELADGTRVVVLRT